MSRDWMMVCAHVWIAASVILVALKPGPEAILCAIAGLANAYLAFRK